ncbi:MAG: serine/threonine-protein kinase [Gemmataceae bacterium]
MVESERDKTGSYVAPQTGFPPGMLVGGYRIESLIGVGGMGAVYRAFDDALGRPIALKVIRTASDDPIARDRLLREARSAAAVVHDNVVRIYQVGEASGAPFIAMELLTGQSVADRLAAGHIPVSEAVRIAKETATGLEAVHRAGFVHRDIKPANLWLENGTGRVKLLDFGLARSDGDTAITHTGMIVGSPAYMSPEQAAGLAADHRADLFSLGCVLYQLVTGRKPFDGPNALAVLHALATITPPAADAVNPEVTPRLAEIISALLVKNPANRTQSATAIKQTLQQFEENAVDAQEAVVGTEPFAAKEDSEPEDRRLAWVTRLVDLLRHTKRGINPTPRGWVASAFCVLIFPLIFGLIGQYLDWADYAYRQATIPESEVINGRLAVNSLLRQKHDNWMVIMGLLGFVAGCVCPIWYWHRRFKRVQRSTIEELATLFPVEVARCGGPVALSDPALLTAIITRAQDQTVRQA